MQNTVRNNATCNICRSLSETRNRRSGNGRRLRGGQVQLTRYLGARATLTISPQPPALGRSTGQRSSSLLSTLIYSARALTSQLRPSNHSRPDHFAKKTSVSIRPVKVLAMMLCCSLNPLAGPVTLARKDCGQAREVAWSRASRRCLVGCQCQDRCQRALCGT